MCGGCWMEWLLDGVVVGWSGCAKCCVTDVTDVIVYGASTDHCWDAGADRGA